MSDAEKPNTEAEPREKGLLTPNSRTEFYRPRTKMTDLLKLQRYALRMMASRMCELDDAPPGSWTAADLAWLTSVAEMTTAKLIEAKTVGAELKKPRKQRKKKADAEAEGADTSDEK